MTHQRGLAHSRDAVNEYGHRGAVLGAPVGVLQLGELPVPADEHRLATRFGGGTYLGRLSLLRVQ